MNIEQIVRAHLEAVGADGLCDVMGQNCISGCSLNDFMPCDEPDFIGCVAGEYNPCPTSPTGFKMLPFKKRKPLKEAPLPPENGEEAPDGDKD